MIENISKTIEKMLLKKALGYKVSEVVEEFGNDKDEGEMKLLKRKITTKHIPPDIAAGKILIELNKPTEECDLTKMSESQLNNEKNRLLNLLKNYTDEDQKTEE